MSQNDLILSHSASAAAQVDDPLQVKLRVMEENDDDDEDASSIPLLHLAGGDAAAASLETLHEIEEENSASKEKLPMIPSLTSASPRGVSPARAMVQESGRKYESTRSSVCSFARITHSCSALHAALICLLAPSPTPELVEKFDNGSFKKKCQQNCSSVFCWSLLLFYSDKLHKQ